jgi:murein DD-endopeptidase MepM/ murein hydrolase activator NlpD
MGLWSFRREFKLVILAFLIVLCLPIVTVLIITQLGIDAVSDALVSVDEVTQHILIKNPQDGSVIAEIDTVVAWPTSGPITLEFGESSLYQPFHTGLDIAGNIGDPITPAMKGMVIFTGEIFWGYGKHVIIDHGNHVQTIYAHLNSIRTHVGETVASGTIIGTKGSTGWSTGPHLHFQVNVYGIPVNPRFFLNSV